MLHAWLNQPVAGEYVESACSQLDCKPGFDYRACMLAVRGRLKGHFKQR